ncbi:hypothetical protein E2320_006034 [Naja naja]|nr:hypothetical protein E2320_006034 [Naja naja]
MAGLKKSLKILYTKILGILESMPQDAAYRKYTEKLTKERFDIVKAAENELSLAKKMLKYRPWEPLVEEPPENQWKWPV